MPIELNQGCVDRLKRLLASGLDQVDDFSKSYFCLIVFCRFFHVLNPLNITMIQLRVVFQANVDLGKLLSQERFSLSR